MIRTSIKGTSMKRTALVLLMYLLSYLGFSQSKADTLMVMAEERYDKQDFIGAIKYFREIVVNHKGFEYYNQSVYNLAYTLSQVRDSLDQAIFWFENIRKSDVRDDEKVGGRGIFELYSNYKFYSTFGIANIEYNRGHFKKALDYYRQCITVYPYYSRSGTDLRINKNLLTIYITDCLKGLKMYDDALITILPEALDSDGSSNYYLVVETAIDLIESKYSKKEIKSELEASFKTIKISSDKVELTWRKSEIELSFYALEDDLSPESLISEFKKSAFWKSLEKP